MSDLIERQAAYTTLTEYYHHTTEIQHKALREALERVPSAQPELCEDAVSRQRLLSDLKELVTAWKKYPVMAEEIKGVEAAIGYVELIPSVKPNLKELSETHNALDTISRQAAIDALGGNEPVGDPSKMDDDDVVKMWERIRIINIINKLPSAQPETHEKRTETHACDLISRQAAIDIERNATVDTNPSHFVAHQKFTQFLDDAEISSFGRWQWSNGFNTALTAVGIDLKKLPPAQPEIVQCEDCQHWEQETINDGYCTEMDLRMCDADFYCGYAERRTDEGD